jgi:hypothetical protein
MTSQNDDTVATPSQSSVSVWRYVQVTIDTYTRTVVVRAIVCFLRTQSLGQWGTHVTCMRFGRVLDC